MERVRLRRIAALGSVLAVTALTFVLIGWMIAKVAEHPGVPRQVGDLPPWFVADIGSPRKTPSPAPPAAAEQHAASADRAGAPQREAAGETAISSAPTTAPAPTARAPGSNAGADDDFVDFAGSEVKIILKEYQLVPNKIRVRPGRLAITFVLLNEGRFAHNFHVEGPDVETTASKFGPGNTVRLEVTLQEGEYKISCPLSNHDQRGMHGTLIATSKPHGK